mmetsp:Transcript_11239/g.25612  ORF Transcript_11239/g.25612 Transcript_11239/m.25612 type:complete len:242 (+) Transcript_11239:68-793(+)
MLGIDSGRAATGLAPPETWVAQDPDPGKLLEQEEELKNHMELLRRYLNAPSTGAQVQPSDRADEPTREELERRLKQAEAQRGDAEMQAQALLQHLQSIRMCFADAKAAPSMSQMSSPLGSAAMDAEARVAAASAASSPIKPFEESQILERGKVRQHFAPQPGDSANENLTRFHAAFTEILADSRNRRKLLKQERESFWKGMEALQVQFSPGGSLAEHITMEWPAEGIQPALTAEVGSSTST